MAVDFCPPTVKAQVPAYPPTGAEFSCGACSESFASAAEQRAHAKSERHVYNTKRRLAGLKPISQEAWERKLRESRGPAAGPAKGTAHLKAKKGSRKGSEDTSITGDTPASELSFQPPDRAEGVQSPADSQEAGAASEAAATATAGTVATEDELPWTPECCLFDHKNCGTIEDCLKYSWRNYNFSVPDREYCTDVPGFLTFLRRKITEPPHVCLFCNRRFPDAASVRRHMLDKNHTRVGTEARSRRGLPDKEFSQVLEDEMEDFYDFHGSTREITERITDPKHKVASLLRFADADRDGCLIRTELAALWALATGGEELTEAQYVGACKLAGADPKVGLQTEELGRLYTEGFADLDIHFGALQDRLTQKLVLKAPRRAKDVPDTIKEEGDEDENEEEHDGEEDDDDEDEDDEDGGESSGTEVYECEDEDEFDEVMRVLGLEKATLCENGDLKLPNGSVAVHRDVAHIWKQRGERFSEMAIAEGRGKPRRTAMMLANAPANGNALAMTQKQENKVHKKIFAVLRRAQHQELRMGIHQNLLQKKKGNKMRTIFGDASGGS